MTIVIYALSDPRTGCVRYVGKTAQSWKTRVSRHKRNAYSASDALKDTHLYRWLRNLLDSGHDVHFKVLEEVHPGDDWQAIERKWIAYYRDLHGDDLTNTTPGGDGMPKGFRHTVTAREKISKFNAKVWQGKKFSAEHRKHLSDARMGRAPWNKGLKGLPGPNKGRKFSVEHCRKLSIAHRRARKTIPSQAAQAEGVTTRA